MVGPLEVNQEAGAMIFKAFTIVATALFLTACAKSPESIAPAYQSSFIYENLNCAQLGQESQRVGSALAAASTQQNNARSNDIIGVVLIGLPVSTLSGDNIAPQIAQLKGAQNAIREARMKKKCKFAETDAEKADF
jgi:orotate phosphoribosyltransferase-like protein